MVSFDRKGTSSAPLQLVLTSSSKTASGWVGSPSETMGERQRRAWASAGEGRLGRELEERKLSSPRLATPPNSGPRRRTRDRTSTVH